jgi:hypothetical protein
MQKRIIFFFFLNPVCITTQQLKREEVMLLLDTGGDQKLMILNPKLKEWRLNYLFWKFKYLMARMKMLAKNTGQKTSMMATYLRKLCLNPK